MKYLIILADGAADEPVELLGGKTPLQAARKPYIDRLAREGVNGRLVTVPEGYTSRIAELVKNKISYSDNILSMDYFEVLFGNK